MVRSVLKIEEPLPNLYQCHCSKCRKLSGSSSDTANFLDRDQFKWLSGLDVIQSYRMESGYRSDFCQKCGSSVPYLMDNQKQYWVPAGLLDEAGDERVVAQLYVSNKAMWDEIGGQGTQFAAIPSMKELNQLLQIKRNS
ncbi:MULTISPECIES: GFA family protein [Vibrio]|uniref:GFA family protein n=1 Tax=Vibrio navarrensis TaxID=29495 RepID=A0AAJ4IAB8_9VIBR|nr:MULTISPECIES: GFA family protein [Vibrio]QPL53190.1 GFA family protein [Vibrio navarrensis]